MNRFDFIEFRFTNRESFFPMLWVVFLWILKAIVISFLLVLPGSHPVHSQVPVQVTEVVENHDGRDYYVHTVKSGQTYFSIANTYRIPLDRLWEENPHSEGVLRTGTVLRIPVTPQNESISVGMSDQNQNPSTPSKTNPGAVMQKGELTVLEKMQLEHHVDDILTRALNTHFDPAGYLLDVSIELSTRYYMQDMPVPVIREQRREIDEQLPGLPFIPRDLLRDLGTDREVSEMAAGSMEVRVPEIDRIWINIRADSIYGSDEIDLMRQIVESKITLIPDRGDLLKITQERLTRVMPEPELVISKTDDYYFLLLAGILLFALLTGSFTWYLIVNLQQKKNQYSVIPGTSSPAYEASATLSPAINRIVKKKQDDASVHKVSEMEDSAPSVPPGIYLMQLFMRQPEQFGRLFTYWYEHDGAKGMRRAAAIIQNIDPKILGLLHGTMSAEAFRSLEGAMCTPMFLPSIKTDALLKQFAQHMKLREQQNSITREFAALPSFDFLQFTDDEELFNILETETDRVKALVLSHLSNPRKRKLLQEFGLEEASRIIFCLAQVRNIPFHEYEKIASRLFEQRAHTGNPENGIQLRDIEYIVSVIEMLPVSDHEKYIRQLDHLEPDLAEAVRKRVITMERISELDDQVLEPAIDGMTRDELAAALVGTGETLRARLLQFRPTREEELIREEIENMVFLSRSEIDKARGKLLRSLQQIIKSKQEASAETIRM